MSKDIRSFFTLVGSAKKKETNNVETKPEKITKPQKKKRVAIISDSDDDDVPATPVKKKKSTNSTETCSKYFKEAKKPVAEKPRVELRAVNAADIFGCDRVKRSTTKTLNEPVVEVPVHKPKKGKRQPSVTLDDGKEFDLDFEATLLQLDEIEAKANEEFRKESQETREGEPSESTVGAKNKASSSKSTVDAKKNALSSESTVDVKNRTSPRKSTVDVKNKASSDESTVDAKNKASSSKSTVDVKNRTSPRKSTVDAKNKASSDESTVDVKNKASSSKSTVNVKNRTSPRKNTVDAKNNASSPDKHKSKAKAELTTPDRGSKLSNGFHAKEEKQKRERSKTKGKRSIDYVSNSEEEDEEPKGKIKKEKKKSEGEDETDEPHWANDPAEKRRLSAIGYQRYLQREGPKHLGAKEVPKGSPGILKGLVFVITGVLDSIERDAAAALVVECGGRVTASLSKNTSYLVVGEDAGPVKVEKAVKLGTPRINEDELFDLIRTKSGLPALNKSTKEKSDSSPNKSTLQVDKKSTKAEREKQDPKQNKSTSQVEKKSTKEKSDSTPNKSTSQVEKKSTKSEREKSDSTPTKYKSQVDKKKEAATSPKATSPCKPPTSKGVVASSSSQPLPPSLLWVDKYRPTALKGIIGQQGDKSNVKKLLNWLRNWHHNQFSGKKLVRPSPWAKDDDGAFFKGALLSGPPGVGKTTSAHLVSKELGFDIVEFNASDTRSKRLLHEEVSELLSNTSLNDYFKVAQGKTTSKHILLMDEVDGMAGNEDRGGMQELIQLIKSSKVPILCMCNDVHHQKIRSLLGHCYDLRFQKPRVEQIRGAMQSVLFKEGVKVPPDVLTDMITGSNQDVRQVLHHLSLYSAAKGTGPREVVVSKHVKLGPWDVMKKVFSAEEHKKMSINDKSDLFFHDYNISPLFVQENYLSVLPDAANNNQYKRLDLIAQAANSICMGDTVERCIRSKNTWSLLPVQAMYASVIPGDLLEGHMTSQINFPSWLGKNSRRNKFDRLLQELHSHTRLSISGNKQSLNLDYLPRLREAITRPLIERTSEGIPDSIHVLQAYHLLRTDVDSIMELSVWPGEQDPLSRVESKVKAALTRTYNKDLILPYSTMMTVSKKKPVALTLEGDDADEEEEEEDADDLAADAMIKAKKRPAPKQESAAGPSKAKRGRGRGKK